MPTSRRSQPKHSHISVIKGLKTFASIKARHTRWMEFAPAENGKHKLLYPHPVYAVQLSRLMEGKSLSSTVKRTGWMYFLRDRKGKLACCEVSMISGKHKNTRLTEGPFVRKAFAMIEKSIRDMRLLRKGYELRSIRAESAHLFCLWVRVKKTKEEHFIPVISSSAILKAGTWVTRKGLTDALRSETQRIRTAHERMSKLLEKYHGPDRK
jgi:hypothetical protein